MKYLGIDYGKSKIGLALSEGQIASIFKVVSVNGLKDAARKILEVIEEEKIGRVVIGVPESGEALSITKKFIKTLRQKLARQHVEVIEVEETLSSFEAHNLMKDLNLPQKDLVKKEDQYAAAIILQNFLDSLQ